MFVVIANTAHHGVSVSVEHWGQRSSKHGALLHGLVVVGVLQSSSQEDISRTHSGPKGKIIGAGPPTLDTVQGALGGRTHLF